LLGNGTVWLPDIEAEWHAYFAKHPERLRELAPRRFEELVASIFRNQGFDVELTPASRDGGFDVLAIHKDVFTGESKYLVECKRYAATNTVGIGIVQRLLGVVEDQKATKGLVATTSYFTRDARLVEERNRSKLALNDYDVLVGWLLNLNS
jgi:restriction system protein